MHINEIFYSLQGEGRWTGTPCVFVRFAGCNLSCPFCDTKHHHGELYNEEELLREIDAFPTTHVVLTGGEPTLQVTRSLVDALHERGKYVHIETNGSRPLADWLECVIDWITLSPKDAPVAIQRADELKLVFQGDGAAAEKWENYPIANTNCYYLQPCDTKNDDLNRGIIASCVEYIKQHPTWKLSLQTQKILNVR